MNVATGIFGASKRGRFMFSGRSLPNVARSILLNYFSVAIRFILGICIARWAGPVARGQYAATTTGLELSTRTFSTGIPSAVSHAVLLKPDDSTKIVKGGVLSAVLVTLASVTFMAAAVTASVVSGWKPSFEYSVVAVVACLYTGPAMMIGVHQARLMGSGKAERFYFAQFLENMASLCVLVTVWFVVGEMNLTVLGLVILVRLYVRGLVIVPKCKIHVSLTEARKLLKYGLRSWPATLLQFAGNQADQLLIGLVAGYEVLGVYAVAVSMNQLFPQLATVLASDLYTEYSNLGSNLQSVKQITARGFKRALSLGIPLTITSAIPIFFLTERVFGSEFSLAVPAALILLPGSVFLVLSAILTHSMLAFGKPGDASKTEVVGVLVNGILVVFLASRFGAIGAAGASTVAYVARVLVALFYQARGYSPSLGDKAVAHV